MSETLESHLGFVKITEQTKLFCVDIPLWDETKQQRCMVGFCITPDDAKRFRIYEGQEINVVVPCAQDQYCRVVYARDRYGRCDICDGKFEYGKNSLRISNMVHWQSQGEPQRDDKGYLDLHAECFTPELVTNLKQLLKEKEIKSLQSRLYANKMCRNEEAAKHTEQQIERLKNYENQ